MSELAGWQGTGRPLSLAGIRPGWSNSLSFLGLLPTTSVRQIFPGTEAERLRGWSSRSKPGSEITMDLEPLLCLLARRGPELPPLCSATDLGPTEKSGTSEEVNMDGPEVIHLLRRMQPIFMHLEGPGL
jgi:hypothetical protein